jgi:hypothetical protein
MSDIIQFNYKDHWQEIEINLERVCHIFFDGFTLNFFFFQSQIAAIKNWDSLLLEVLIYPLLVIISHLLLLQKSLKIVLCIEIND